MYLVVLPEFGGKGDRWANIANSKEQGEESSRQKAVSRKRESGNNKLIAGWGDTESVEIWSAECGMRNPKRRIEETLKFRILKCGCRQA